MSAWRVIGLVWKREITERGKSKVFLIATGLTLLLITAAFVGPTLAGGEADEVRIGYIGQSGAGVLATAGILADLDESFDLISTEYPDLGSGESALEEGTIEALLVDGSEVVTEGQGQFSVNAGASLLQQAASANRVERLVAETGMSGEEVVELLTNDLLTTRTLSGVDADDATREVVAYAGLMLMYAAILMYGSWTLAGVTEEKANRVVEILVSTIEPWQLLAGKVAGIGTLGLAQFGLTIAYSLVLARLTGAFEVGAIPVDSGVMVVLWFVLGFAIYAVMFAAVGALVSRSEDAQSASTPVTIAAVVSFLVTIVTLEDPSGITARISTFVPFTAPYTVPVRYSLDAIAWWEVAVSAVLTIIAMVGMILIAGRIYRGALLSFGARLKIREAWRSARG